MTETKEKNKNKTRDVVIKHGLFYYHEPTTRIVGGEEKEVLVERLAFHGQKVTLTRASDMERGDEHGAFFSDEELKDREAPAALPASADAETADGESRPVGELDDEELVDWLMSTGEFDGKKKPTANEVVDAIGDDPELADRVLTAEETASGGNPRKAIEDHVDKVTAGDEGEGE